jgi:class 3 adenylate cyclase/alpha-beta hydrolase superfamily lysophospholipase
MDLKARRLLDHEIAREPVGVAREMVDIGSVGKDRGVSPVPETRFVRSGDVDIAYQVFGSGPRNLLALSGWVSHLEVIWELPEFARFLERLGSIGRVVTFDKRGTGMSDRPAKRSTLEDHVGDVLAVLDAAGMPRASLLGWADSVAIVAAFAVTHPSRVDALVLNSFLATPTKTVPREFVAAYAEAQATAWGQARTLPIVAPSVAGDERVQTWMRRLERLSATPNVAAAMSEWALSLDIDQLLPAIQAPTLVLHRRDVASVPAEAVRRGASLIPNARYVELPGSDLYPIFGDVEAVLGEIEEFLTGTRPAAPSDRVLATVLFTDIVGSTQRAQELGDRRWRDLIEAHNAVVRKLLAQFDGVEVDTAGDGFFATFDGPARAVRCARAIVEAVRGLGLEIRAGLHAGEVERSEGKVTGIAVHVGARVSALAAPSEVLVTSTVKDLVLGSELTFEDRGVRALKGVPNEWHLYAAEDGSDRADESR